MTVPLSTLGEVSLGAEDAALAVAAVKAQLRIDGGVEDGWIAGLCATSLSLCERFTGRVAIEREMQVVLSAGSGWQALPDAPVRAITGVEGLPAEGAAFALPADAYAIDIDGGGRGWVRVTQPGAAGRVRVTYTAGLADSWDALPPSLAQGAVLLAAHLFDGRESEPPPAAVAALWRPWRRMCLKEPVR